MGSSKALLDAGGATFLERVVDALLGGGCEPVVVVVREGDEDERRLAALAGATVVVNPDPADGPISSVRTALDRLPEDTDGVVVLHVDRPLVRADTVAALVAAGRRALSRPFRPGGGGSPGILLPCTADRRGHPPLFLASVLPELRDPGLEGGARTVVRRLPHRVLEVPVDDPGILLDVDDPGRYEEVFGSPPRALAP